MLRGIIIYEISPLSYVVVCAAFMKNITKENMQKDAIPETSFKLVSHQIEMDDAIFYGLLPSL